jgi:hypothetical protein
MSMKTASGAALSDKTEKIRYNEVESTGDEFTSGDAATANAARNLEVSHFTKAYLGEHSHSHSGAAVSTVLGKRKASNMQSLGQAFRSSGVAGNIDSAANYNALPDASWGRRYAHAKRRLYVLVHNIDGNGFEAAQVQQLLASFASCASVSVIATADKLNFQLIWDSSMLCQYRWMYVHCPTFESYRTDSKSTLKLGMGTSSKRTYMDSQAYEYIVKSLNSKFKEVLSLLGELIFQQRRSQRAKVNATTGQVSSAAISKVTAKNKPTIGNSNMSLKQPLPALPAPGSAADGVAIDVLFEASRNRMVVLNPADLRQLIKDLMGHRLVALMDDDRRKLEVVSILMPDASIRELLNVK